jgi:Methyltransferase domain
VSAALDQRYYEVVKPSSIGERLFIEARDRIFQDFLDRMQPVESSRILDVGVSDNLSVAANVLERKYQHRHNITACGIETCAGFQSAFPDIRYVQIAPNARLPFADKSFDIATSNAVLEHVGSAENQSFFVRELARVARRAFISVPNRYFPVEHHTAVPLLHYSDRGFELACSALGKSFWTDDANLILMTRKQLWRLAAELPMSVAVGYTGLRFGPFSSNLYLALH